MTKNKKQTKNNRDQMTEEKEPGVFDYLEKWRKEKPLRALDVLVILLCLSGIGVSLYLFQNDLFKSLRSMNVAQAGTIFRAASGEEDIMSREMALNPDAPAISPHVLVEETLPALPPAPQPQPLIPQPKPKPSMPQPPIPQLKPVTPVTPVTPTRPPEPVTLPPEPAPLVKFFPSPENRLPENGHTVGVEELRFKRNIVFRWSEVEGANAYILTISREGVPGRLIFQSEPMEESSYTFDNLLLLENHDIIYWHVEALFCNNEGKIEQRGLVSDYSLELNVPRPGRVMPRDMGIIYGTE